MVFGLPGVHAIKNGRSALNASGHITVETFEMPAALQDSPHLSVAPTFRLVMDKKIPPRHLLPLQGSGSR